MMLMVFKKGTWWGMGLSYALYRIVTVIYVVIYYGAKYQNLCHWEQTKKTDIGRLREANLFSAKI